MTAPDDAELARLQAEAEAAEAALKLAQAKAALAAAQAEAARSSTGDATSRPPAPAPTESAPTESAPTESAPTESAPAKSAPTEPESEGPLGPADIAAITKGYTFEGTTLDLGALMNGEPLPSAQIRIPLGMLNRHGLVAGATGTGKTRTLQGLAEQLADKGVPVFAADMKGDLSGMATAGEPSDKLLARTRALGQDWKPEASVVEFFALGGVGKGVPVRATVSGFGPSDTVSRTSVPRGSIVPAADETLST